MSEQLQSGETYDVAGAQRELARMTNKPALREKFRARAIKRAKDIFESGELGSVIKPTDKVLYVGAGTGHVAQYIEQQTGATLYKTDLADLRTKDTIDNKFFLANGRILPMKDNSLNVVTLMDMLHHCLNQEQLIKEALRVLQPGGNLIILENAIPEANQSARRKMVLPILNKLDDILNAQRAGINPHNFHSIEEWRNILRNSGFKGNIDVKHWYWGPADLLVKTRPKSASRITLMRPFQSVRFVATK